MLVGQQYNVLHHAGIAQLDTSMLDVEGLHNSETLFKKIRMFEQ